jgi:predicted RNA-binding Zn-ribbon protein involved in translation (DUF1610 family)
MNLPSELKAILQLHINEHVVQWWDNISKKTENWEYLGYLIITNERVLCYLKKGILFSSIEPYIDMPTENIKHISGKIHRQYGYYIQIDGKTFFTKEEPNIYIRLILTEKQKRLAILHPQINNQSSLPAPTITQQPQVIQEPKIPQQTYEEWYQKTLQFAQNYEKALRYEDSAKLYESLEMWEEAGRVRRRAKEQTAPQTSINIGEIDKSTNISDSIIQRSQIGSENEKTGLKCPSCGEEINLTKPPKLCPYCGEKLV